MILRGIAIFMAVGAAWALWVGYGQLGMFRGTPFWDYRYLIFAVSAFLVLSGLEWVLGWIKAKFASDTESH
jgi:hypothetical protein